MAKRLYDALKDCNKEEEVKSEFCKFFKMKINALKSIGLLQGADFLAERCNRGILGRNQVKLVTTARGVI